MSELDLSIPDRAARLVAKMQEARDSIERLGAQRRASVSAYQSLADDAEGTITAALMGAWQVFERLNQIAQGELKRDIKKARRAQAPASAAGEG